ncbi:hypothetical protein TNCV_837281 [Trichonephila clavipes]|nr:hypothetical protein TNCV_837281 [Trichonephila clavipes]
MCWFPGPAPQMNVGRMRKVWPELSFLVMEVMCWFSGPAPQMNVGRMRKVWLGNIIDLTSFSFEYFVTAGVVVLFLIEVLSWISGPAPQTNVGGMREGPKLDIRPGTTNECGWNAEGRWEKIDLTSFSIEYFVTAGVVVLFDRGPKLDIRPSTTNECGWNAGG